MSPRVCRGCGGEVSAAARFCPGCGASLAATRRTLDAAIRSRTTRAHRAGLAIAVVLVGVLLSVIAGSVGGAADELRGVLVGLSGMLACGAGAVALLGRGALRAATPIAAGPVDLLLAVPAGLAAFTVGAIYTRLLLAVLPGDAGEPAISRVAVLAAVIYAPLVEEWLCRGVLWEASSRTASARTTLFLTSGVFALLHGLEGGALSLPHRFVYGLLFGLLRARSDSILPGILAHAILNLLAVMLLT